MAFVVLHASGNEPRTYELNKPKFVVGRDNRCDIHIDNLAVSKQHCEFSLEDGHYVVRDLKSSNKTFVNGQEITEHKLADGEEIVIGAYRMKFNNPAAAAQRPASTAPADDNFEPTLQLPPEMVRKKLEEMQRERAAQAGGGSAPAAHASGPAKPMTAKDYAAQQGGLSQSGSEDPAKKSGMAVTLFVIAIIAVVVVNVLIFVKYKS
jgi:pSer/pThr/pTyr-binding forkhead associated (FHA) protein